MSRMVGFARVARAFPDPHQEALAMAFGGWGKRMSKGLTIQSAPPVAIDFGVGALKVLQISAGTPMALVAAACLETPEDLLGDPAKRFEFQTMALPRLMKAGGFTSRRVACAIPAGQAYCKHAQLQAGDSNAIAAQVRGTVSSQMGCDPSALLYRHIDVGPVGRNTAGGKTEVICMAVARDLVERVMGAIRAAKLELVGMSSEFHAVVRAMTALSVVPEEQEAPNLYLDLGAGSTKIAVAHGDKLVFARAIDLGGRHMDHAIARQTRTDLGEARHLRLRLKDLAPATAAAPAANAGGTATAVAEPDWITRQANRAVAEPLEILTDEIAMCLRYADSLFPGKRPTRVTFLGGESRHTALCTQIARVLKMTARAADPVAGVARTGKEPCRGVDFSTPQPGWAMVLGLALCPTDL